MLTDALLQLSSAQAVTTTAVSTNTIDLGTARDIGTGEDLYAVITVDEAATASGSATVNFQVITSANANLSSANIISQTDAIAKTDLTLARKPIVICINPALLLSLPVGQRYLGVQYTVATGPLTAGKFSATITNTEVSVNQNYPSGFSVA